MPEKIIHSVQTTWEEYQNDLYLQYRNDLKATIQRNGIVTEDKAEGVLKRLLRLVQVASNPLLNALLQKLIKFNAVLAGLDKKQCQGMLANQQKKCVFELKRIFSDQTLPEVL